MRRLVTTNFGQTLSWAAKGATALKEGQPTSLGLSQVQASTYRILWLRCFSDQAAKAAETETTEVPPSLPSDNSHPASAATLQHESEDRVDSMHFHRAADIYLGGLWNRFEAELRENEGEDFDYDVQLTSGCMRVSLPDDAQIVICKDPAEHALKVESNLHTEGPDPRDTAAFHFDPEAGAFADGSMALHDYLEAHLSRHLNVDLDLEPQFGPNAKVYGADPT